MKVYVAYALPTWYGGLLPYLRHTRGRLRGTPPSLPATPPNAGNRSLFVCLEEASDLRRERNVYDSMMDFLFPGADADGGGRHAHPFPKKKGADAGAGGGADGALAVMRYDGPHATIHDPDQRNRLAHIVTRLDGSLFKNRIALTDTLIGCPPASP